MYEYVPNFSSAQIKIYTPKPVTHFRHQTRKPFKVSKNAQPIRPYRSSPRISIDSVEQWCARIVQRPGAIFEQNKH